MARSEESPPEAFPRPPGTILSVYVIAEAGVNHNGSLELARELVVRAARAGADAVKFQTFRAEANIGAGAPKAAYQVATTGSGESQLEMVRRLELDEAAHRDLAALCWKEGIEFLSTPFDLPSVELLRSLGVRRLKVPSGEVTNGPLLLAVARTGLPALVSTGMATLGEIEDCLGALAFGYLKREERPGLEVFQRAFSTEEGQRALQDRVTLLHCTTEYPAPFADVNLRAMGTLCAAFGLPIGYSDHTEGIAVPVAAAALGAAVIEKHFTLDRGLPGPDHRASVEPAELESMVRSIRQVEQALGSARKGPAPSELPNREIARKSLVALRAVQAGELFSEQNLGFKRPGSGLSPMRFWERLGQPADRAYAADEGVE